MECTFTRDDVRLLLAQHRQRLLRAQQEGNFLAVAHDVTDELNGALAYLAQRHGMDEVYRFKWLYAEAQREAELQGVSFQIPGMTGPQRVILQSQLPPPRKSRAGAVVVLVALFVGALLLGLVMNR
ncbi:hypothetical protein MCP1_290031 [Candidatus Terasakiella magnetica]|nr:hypothetical protein MCP1_290031 [Candidatus Terasakiella magnetica]